ncbi:type VI secretion system-associated protein TagF [Roseomonas sp. JC162]|uniref:Type VI secretion system-associated protein TagF n=1 Tax=Neoroseomonas marina TaxID=1232220 RepID=A0A848E6B4_9PROT|nr:type VI secretion system-associated protein TagF [Neoroseomonas marina]NMJ39951.1 type VI secretion system-associated protein TagF [Neoroseomonas marina]
MPDLLPLTGLYGKVPAHGDFVRRGLPSTFVAPWDEWLQAAMSRARMGLGTRWEDAWDAAPAWRFALPAGACGPDAVAGVMLPSVDTVGRRFPITLAALLPVGAAVPDDAWFDALEGAALAGRFGQADADAMAAAIPVPGGPPAATAFPLLAPTAPHADRGGAPQDDAWDKPPGAAMAHEADTSGAHDAAPSAPDDVMALLGTGPVTAGKGSDPDSIVELDVLSVFAGGAAPPAPPADGTLAMLLGGEPDRETPTATPDPFDAFLGDFGTTPAPNQAAAPADTPADPLQALLGGAETPLPPVAALPSWSDDDGPDPLATLMAAAPEPAPPESVPAPEATAPPVIPDDVEFLGFADPVDEAWPGDAASAVVHGAAAPPAPEGGGWWTRGASRVPPMVWPLHGLPSPDDFAYLLEAEA